MMSHLFDFQLTLDDFLDKLSAGDFKEYAAKLAILKKQTNANQKFNNWYSYFNGVLTQERDLDWSSAQQIFENLLSRQDLEPILLKGQILLSLGNAYMRQGQWVDAIKVTEQAFPIFTRLELPREQAKVGIQIAEVYLSGYITGDYPVDILENALVNCTLALSAITLANQVNNALTLKMYALTTQGAVFGALRKQDDAIGSFNNVLQISQDIGNEYFSGFAYLNLGEIFLAHSEYNLEQVIDTCQKAIGILRKYQDTYQELETTTNIAFAYETHQDYPNALDYYVRAMSMIDSVRQKISSYESRIGFLSTVSDVYARAVLTCLKLDRAAEAFAYVEEASSRAFLDSLRADSFEQQDANDEAFASLKLIQANLPKEGILLTYFTTGVVEDPESRHHPDEHYRRHRFPPEKILIFAVTHDAFESFTIDTSPNLLYPTERNATVEQHFLRAGMREFLYNTLIQPVEALVQDKSRIYICPHGPLHYIPFQALIKPNQARIPLEKTPEIVMAPSVTILMRDLLHPPKKEAANKVATVASSDTPIDAPIDACLAVGFDGVVEDQSIVLDPDTIPLAHAETEAVMIAYITTGEALVGAPLKKDKILAKAPTYRYLHFSCHGDFKPDAPMESALHIGPNETLTAGEVIEKLRLSNCRLVTLNACETALNQVVRGDELFGFVRAFLFAGAKAIVATQWRVDERTTRIFAEKFVRRLQDGADVATAVKDAQYYLRYLPKSKIVAYLERFDDETGHGHVMMQAAYVRSRANFGGAIDPNIAPPLEDLFADAEDDVPVLANYPFYWGPYILIGDPDLK